MKNCRAFLFVTVISVMAFGAIDSVLAAPITKNDSGVSITEITFDRVPARVSQTSMALTEPPDFNPSNFGDATINHQGLHVLVKVTNSSTSSFTGRIAHQYLIDPNGEFHYYNLYHTTYEYAFELQPGQDKIFVFPVYYITFFGSVLTGTWTVPIILKEGNLFPTEIERHEIGVEVIDSGQETMAGPQFPTGGDLTIADYLYEGTQFPEKWRLAISIIDLVGRFVRARLGELGGLNITLLDYLQAQGDALEAISNTAQVSIEDDGIVDSGHRFTVDWGNGYSSYGDVTAHVNYDRGIVSMIFDHDVEIIDTGGGDLCISDDGRQALSWTTTRVDKRIRPSWGFCSEDEFHFAVREPERPLRVEVSNVLTVGPLQGIPGSSYSSVYEHPWIYNWNKWNEDPSSVHWLIISAGSASIDIPGTKTIPYIVSSIYSNINNTNIKAIFSEDMDESTLTESNISVQGSSSGNHSCTFVFNHSTYELTINPNTDFTYGETVIVTIGTGVNDNAGNGLANPYTISFTIGAIPVYTVSASAGSNGTINPSGDISVAQGGSQAFTATPNPGYEVQYWFKNGVVVQTGGTSYTLANVQADTSIHVWFQYVGASPEITVVTPTDGNTYSRGRQMPIGWESSGDTGSNVKIELWRGGALNTTIASSTSYSGHYSWGIPSDQAIGTDYKIRITSVSAPSVYGESNGVFAIAAYTPLPTVIEISTSSQLQSMSQNWGDASHPINGYYKLMNDIDLAGSWNWNGGLGFKPIGNSYSDYFRGIFDGQGHTIFNLGINRPDSTNGTLVGLFSLVMDTGVVKNLTMRPYGIFGYGYSGGSAGGVGCLAGISDGTIINCHVIDDSSGLYGWGGNYIGGLVGQTESRSVIQNCSFAGLIQAKGSEPEYFGGLVGDNSGQIAWCSTSGTVNGLGSTTNGSSVGGLVGRNNSSGLITESYSTSTVRGEYYVGGIVGRGDGGQIRNCFFDAASIEASSSRAGGIVGILLSGGLVDKCYVSGDVSTTGTENGTLAGWQDSFIENSFWKNTMTLPTVGSGNAPINCFGKTIVEMMQEVTFTTAHGTNWDFDNIWTIEEGVTYPQLRGIGSMLSPPTGVMASTGLEDGIHLSWNAASGADAYRVYRADSSDGTKTVVGDWQSGASFIDTTAVPDFNYYYWIRAAATINGACASEFSGAVQGSRITPPMNAPANITATDGHANVVFIEWDPVPEAGYYRVYRATSDSGAPVALGAWQTECIYSDVPPIPSTPHYYWVTAALDSGGTRESDLGGPDTGYYIIPDVTAPVVSVSSSPVLPIETQNITLSVTASDDQMLDRIVLHWKDTEEHTQPWDISTATTTQSLAIGSYSPGQILELWAEAWDTSDNRSESEHYLSVIQTETVSPPNRPDGPGYLKGNESGTFITGGAQSNIAGNPVEYLFDWADGSTSDWGPATQVKAWTQDGQYPVKAQARSQANPSRVSDWSINLPVIVDSLAPNAPLVTGTTPTNDATPTWTWIPAGEDGNGTFRYQLDSEAGPWTETIESTFTPGMDLNEGGHILYVQERDGAGNWSISGSFAITVDVTPPVAPNVNGPASPANNPKPAWTWTSGGAGNGTFRYDLDASGVWTETTDTSFSPSVDLAEGTHRLTVQERDEAGNWSLDGFFDVSIVITSPEGEGEVLPEGEGEVLPEGEGEVLPEGEGEVLPEGEGEVLPEGEGEVLPEGEGEVLPEGEGEVLPEGEGEVPPEGEGEVLPEGEGEVLPEGEGEVLPEGEGEVLPEGEGEVLPEGEGEIQPEGEGEVPAEGEGEVIPEGEGEVLPEGEGEVLPEGEGEVLPEGEGEVLPEGEGEVLPEGEGEVLPEGEGEVLPEGEGEVLPEGEGEVLPEGEGEVLAEGEGEVLPEGEGEGDSEIGGCCRQGGKASKLKEMLERTFGDWLLVGLSMLALVGLVGTRP